MPIANQGLTISSIKVEQKMKFQSRIPGMAAGMGGQMEGHSNGLETYVLIDTEESEDVIAQMSESSRTRLHGCTDRH